MLSAIILMCEVFARWCIVANYLKSKDCRLIYLSPSEDMHGCPEGRQLLDDLESNTISTSSDENRRFTEILR